MITNGIFIGDGHIGDQLALCPETFILSNGSTYHASPLQLKILEYWHYFWDIWVPQATKGEPYCVVFNGDMIEGRHHQSTHAVSNKKSDHFKMAEELLKPIVDKAKAGTYYLSGTSPAHAGPDGEDEETFAKTLGAVQNEYGQYSRYELWIDIGSAHVHVSHHIGVTGSMAYETTALTKEYNEFCAESARWGERPPDIIVRAHRHRHSEVRVPTGKGYGIIFVVPAWQLKTPWLFMTPGGRIATPVLGGSLIRQGDEEFFTRHKTWEIQRSRTEVPEVL